MVIRANAWTVLPHRGGKREHIAMLDFAGLIAVLACTWFAGAAVYVTAVEHPARLSCGTEIAVTQWAPSYKRGALMQAPLALIAGILGIARGVLGDDGAVWLVAGGLILAVVPFTLAVIRPTNDRLLDPRRDRRSEETLQLLTSWGHLHSVRTVVSVVASVLFVWAASR
jgi:uncharacterized membrane protein